MTVPSKDSSFVTLAKPSSRNNFHPFVATNDGPATLVAVRLDPCSTPVSRQAYVPWPHVRGYEILSVIGSGGMGIVYKARHRDLNRTVALKMLRGAALQDPELRERFQAEAEAVENSLGTVRSVRMCRFCRSDLPARTGRRGSRVRGRH